MAFQTLWEQQQIFVPVPGQWEAEWVHWNPPRFPQTAWSPAVGKWGCRSLGRDSFFDEAVPGAANCHKHPEAEPSLLPPDISFPKAHCTDIRWSDDPQMALWLPDQRTCWHDPSDPTKSAWTSAYSASWFPADGALHHFPLANKGSVAHFPGIGSWHIPLNPVTY